MIDLDKNTVDFRRFYRVDQTPPYFHLFTLRPSSDPCHLLALSQGLIDIHYLCTMGRIMGIDYGSKRTGLAITDPMKMIAQPLEMVYTVDLKQYLDSYLTEEIVECFVVGMPTQLSGEDTDATQPVKQFINALKTTYPSIPVEIIDERLSSREAQHSILLSGAKKTQRADKGLVDKVSAALILQTYLQKIS